tara:strand:+ start:9749 stop:11575 length:1827 start_codon:yes stop_codon:yes gene_type:complete
MKATLIVFFFFFTHLYNLYSENQPLLQNMVQRDSQTLNGLWHYIVDMNETGYYSYRWEAYDEQEKPRASAYFTNSKPKHSRDLIEYNFDTSPTLRVPGDWNSQNEKLFYYEGTLWYKKSFDVQNFDDQKRYYVHFGAVNYRADVYVNGKKLGTHIGGFTPFNFEVTGLLNEKDNFIVVRVDNKRAAGEVPTLNTDWWNFGGITRDVSIIELSNTFIEDYKVQLDKENANLISGYVRLNGIEKSKNKVVLEIEELGISETFYTNEEGYLNFQIPVKSLTYWSDKNPKLYTVNLTAGSDQLSDQIGFRHIRTEGSDIYLNDEKVFLKGICIHEENGMRGGRAFSMEDAKVLLGWAKELGCNYVRLAHYPHNENMARLADSMGILLWEEIPVYWTIQWNNPETFIKAERQLEELITRDKNRASVIIWSMANETPPSNERLLFLKNLVEKTRELDDTRLVTAALENHGKKGQRNTMVVDDDFASFVDIVSFNQYHGWYGGSLENIKNLRWEIEVDKPVIISEFGAGALQGYHGDEQTIWSEAYQNALYRETLPTLMRIPQISGISPWILVDFRSPRRTLIPYQNGWNRKGLISETGNKKQAFYTLRNFYSNL